MTFTLGNETYGVDVLHVTEVIRYTEITPVPGAPAHVLGIMNLRDTIITVNDLCIMLRLSSTEITDQTRIMLMEWEGQHQGMLVDSVIEIINVKASEIDTTTTSGKENQITLGTCQRNDKLYILLSVRELMRDDGP